MQESGPTDRDKVKALIDEERSNQDLKWGIQNHRDSVWLAILAEEIGEVAKAILERKYVELDKELTQVCAVAVAWKECRMRKQSCDCVLCCRA